KSPALAGRHACWMPRRAHVAEAGKDSAVPADAGLRPAVWLEAQHRDLIWCWGPPPVVAVAAGPERMGRSWSRAQPERVEVLRADLGGARDELVEVILHGDVAAGEGVGPAGGERHAQAGRRRGWREGDGGVSWAARIGRPRPRPCAQVLCQCGPHV